MNPELCQHLLKFNCEKVELNNFPKPSEDIFNESYFIVDWTADVMNFKLYLKGNDRIISLLACLTFDYNVNTNVK